MAREKESANEAESREADALGEYLHRFEDAWHKGLCPRIEDHLPADAAARRALLPDLVLVDLERRLKAGEAIRVEVYLDRFPELGSDPQAVGGLLLAEYKLRRRHDPRVRPEEYLRRFPQYATLVQQWQAPTGSRPDSPNPTTVHDLPQPGPAAPAAPAEVVGSGLRYQPVRFHARGGLGEVLLAEDNELHRQVALKRIQRRHLDDPESRRRFLLEAEITGQLEHPGIVPVYGLVQDSDGQPCYAMRFIAGESLKDAIERFYQEDGRPGRDAGGRGLALRSWPCATPSPTPTAGGSSTAT
jgi:hypothetical protein